MRTIKRDIVGAFIFSADGCLLLGKSNRGTYEGQWIVPGGGLEEGETLTQALIREVLEETGIDISKANIEKMDIDLTGQSKKIMKNTKEEVLGVYRFFNYVVHMDKEADSIKTTPDDDFTEPLWQPLSQLAKIDLSPPTKTSLKHMGIL